MRTSLIKRFNPSKEQMIRVQTDIDKKISEFMFEKLMKRKKQFNDTIIELNGFYVFIVKVDFDSFESIKSRFMLIGKYNFPDKENIAHAIQKEELQKILGIPECFVENLREKFLKESCREIGLIPAAYHRIAA